MKYIPVINSFILFVMAFFVVNNHRINRDLYDAALTQIKINKAQNKINKELTSIFEIDEPVFEDIK